MGVLGENQKSLRIKLKVQKKLRQKKLVWWLFLGMKN